MITYLSYTLYEYTKCLNVCIFCFYFPILGLFFEFSHNSKFLTTAKYKKKRRRRVRNYNIIICYNTTYLDFDKKKYIKNSTKIEYQLQKCSLY